MTPSGVLLTLIFAATQLTKGLRGQCVFPDFLRRPFADGSDRTWVTEIKFVENSNQWDTQLEITVSMFKIDAKLRYKAQCHQNTGTVTCFQRELHYDRVCMRREDGGKYLVQHHDKGRAYFLCMKFIQRNRNIIQVWSSPRREENSNELCGEHLMQREVWPWIAPDLEEWAYSPIVGGFDFTTFLPDRRKKMCSMVWRPSRMETECVRGEGIHFSFPEKACSPFMNHRQEMKLQVWGHWKEDDYMFIVAAEFGKIPQFVLRFPRDYDMTTEIKVDLYFSPICPNGRRPSPVTADLDKVRQAELSMKKGEPGICFDQSDHCVRHAQEGKCTNSALHQYANYCKRSCGLCNLLPSPRPECRFPSDIRKDWFLFEKDRLERVRIHGGHLGFSTLGEFICKSKHWSADHYKLLSYYSNGCRPRYTCVHFSREMGDSTLQFQISKSDTVDRSFDLCEFEDDPKPLGGLIRSADLKTLIEGSSTKHNNCGLEGTVAVNVTLPGGYSCTGHLSDWDSEICAVRPRLQLSLKRCTKRRDYLQEFECRAYINMHQGMSFLITQDPRTQVYTCWVIYTYPERMSYKPWREAYRLKRAQCGLEEDNDPNVPHDSDLHLQVFTDHVEKPCPSLNKTPAPPVASPTTKTPSKDIRATEDDRKDQSHQQYRASAASRSLSSGGLLLCLCTGALSILTRPRTFALSRFLPL